ncbi:MAG: adenylate/guanylate cyclase domain-containing protein [Actinomycetota bacterium]
MTVCANCGQSNPERFRFCGACGAELTAERTAQQVRKTVTVLFCDVTGSTSLGEQLDPESLRRTMGQYFDEIRRVVERHGGTVEKFIGDAVMAVFGIPRAHEDDALRAVRAAGEIRDRIAVLGNELGIALSFRTGVNTGEVVAGEGETLVTGDAVNVAARLEQAAAPGDVLIGADTLALVRDAVVADEVEPLELKGKRDPVAAYRLVSVDPSADAVARRLDSPLVGRERERARLNGDFELAVAERACHLFTLLGPAGVGKSRLVAEFIADVGADAEVLRARCLHYGEDITYWPLVEILLQLGVEPESVIGASPVETQLAFRKLLESRAAERPQLVLLDDIQWAEELFLDLIEHVAEWSRDCPIFLLCVARPELLELRPGWGGGMLNATTILLEALSTDDCERLVDELAGGVAIDPDVRQRILAAADGNPLFLEEMLAMAAEEGGGRELVVPPTIHALLQARLDRLGAGERDVIGRGSVEGQVFHRGVVEGLGTEEARTGVPAHLLTLVRKDVIRPNRSTFPDDDAFRFRHLLIRDAAYDALPKETRAELHERFAAWLEEHGGLVELDEIVGYHLEQAHRNRAALDPSDSRLLDLGHRAAGHLAQAARAALSRGDLGASRGLFTRAAALLPEGDESRLEILRELQWPLSEAGRVDDMRAAIAELEAATEPRFRVFAEAVRLWIPFAAGGWDQERGREQIEKLRRDMEVTGDDLGLAWLELITFAVSWSALRAEEGRGAVQRGAEHAEKAGQPALAAWLRQWEGAALAFGPTPAADVLRMTEDALTRMTSPVERSGGLRRIGRMLACQREFDLARERYREGVAFVRDAGMLRETAASVQGAAYIELRAGDLDAAEAALRTGSEELAALGDRGFYSSVLYILAELLVDRGRDAEASTLCARAREAVSPSDLDAVAGLGAVEGLLAARRGDHAEAERMARAAVEMLGDSDFYDQTAGLRLLLARTLVECGKPDDARPAAAEALAIYEAKGDEPAADWARELLASLD